MQGPDDIVSTKDAGPYQATSFGVAGATFTSADQHSAAAAITDVPASGKKLVITDVEIAADTAMSVTLTCETSGVVVGKYYLMANSTIQITPRGKKKLATADKRLMLQTSVSGNVAATAHYYSEA